MPQQSIYYACGRVGVLERSALGTSQIERLMAAHSYEEACKILCDIGYMPAGSGDYQLAADQQVQKACRVLNELTVAPELTDCFMLRYDVHNLKVLVKSRYLGKKPEYLSTCGTLDVEKLRHAVAEHSYAALPPTLLQTMNGLEKALAKEFDPLLIDASLDQAMYRMIFEKLDSLRAKKETRKSIAKAKEYFTAKADLQNAVMLLRARAMDKPFAFFKDLMLPGGKLTLRALEGAVAGENRLPALLRPYGAKVCEAAKLAGEDPGELPYLEKAADDYLFSLYASVGHAIDSMDVLIAYLLRVQRGALNVRLIIAGKLNDFSEAELMKRVRDMQ